MAGQARDQQYLHLRHSVQEVGFGAPNKARILMLEAVETLITIVTWVRIITGPEIVTCLNKRRSSGNLFSSCSEIPRLLVI